jgi:hypothetical protein
MRGRQQMDNQITTTQPTELPSIFKQSDFDITGVSAITALFEELKRAPEYVIFPSHYDQKFIQKMILLTDRCTLRPGTDGTPGRYILWPAYSLGVYFQKKTLYYGCPFVAQFPKYSFYDMFYRSAGIQFDRILSEYIGKKAPLIEIHFRKKSEREYELVYMAIVEHMGEEITEKGKQDVFRIDRLLFKDTEIKKYTPKGK